MTIGYLIGSTCSDDSWVRVVHCAKMFQNHPGRIHPILVLGYNVQLFFTKFNSHSRAPKPLKTNPNFIFKTVAKLHASLTNFINKLVPETALLWAL